MNILIYFPYNMRSVEQQSVMEMLAMQGHNVHLLTTCARGYLHKYVEQLGVTAHAAEGPEPPGKMQFYRSRMKQLRSVIEENKIELVIAHQQETALIAGLLRKVKKFGLVYVRHNSGEDYQINARKAGLMNRLVNWLTPVKVAPSEVVQRFWTGREKVPARQIVRINYGYNFDQYEKPAAEEVDKIKNKYPASFRMLSMARLVPAKRHKVLFSVVRELVDAGIDCRLLCLGSGPMENELRENIAQLKLNGHIFLLGRKENVFDYIEAADVFVHLSSTEASNSAVKEVGLCRKPVIVCKGVGDFEDYIHHAQNGFLVDHENPAPETLHILKQLASGQTDGARIGEELYRTVMNTFDIRKVAGGYTELLQALSKNKKGL
jgi:glycosyltransferase involved in cell wall biosynthesis